MTQNFRSTKQRRSMSSVSMRRPELSLPLPTPPPAPRSAPTTFRRRRHIADQVYITSTSIHVLTAAVTDQHKSRKTQQHSDYYSNGRQTSECDYYNSSCTSQDRHEETAAKVYAKIRSVSCEQNDVECQEVSVFIGHYINTIICTNYCL